MSDGERYVRHHIYVEALADWLWVAEDSDGELYFPVNASCEAVELETRAAHDLIRRDSRLAPGVRTIRLPTAGGEQAQKCLRSTEYAWWLALTDAPRDASPEKRTTLVERQRVLMGLARDIIVRGRELDVLPSAPRLASAPLTTPQLASFDVSGDGLEGRMHCKRCGAPHIIVIDGAGWHVHLGVTVE